MNTRKAWFEAFRPRTLPLAVASTSLGSFLAWHEGESSLWVALLAILTAIFLQVLSNFSNDYGDFKHGADTEERIGPRRAVASGDISPETMLSAIVIAVLACLASGIGLLLVSFEGEIFDYRLMLVFLAGIIAIAAAIKYTAGKNPYGYRALGDLAAFIFFGWVAVMGTYFLHTHHLRTVMLLPASAFGFLSAGVLNLNNLRDYHTDLKAGKVTMVVKMGQKNGLIYHYFLVGTAWLCMIVYNSIYFFNTNTSYISWLFLLLIPVYFQHLWKTRQLLNINPALLTKQLRQLSFINLLLVLIFGICNLT